MGTMTVVPVAMWPLTDEFAAHLDAMQRDELIRAGCAEDSIEFDIWEYGNYAPINEEPVMGYARIATGIVPNG